MILQVDHFQEHLYIFSFSTTIEVEKFFTIQHLGKYKEKKNNMIVALAEVDYRC